MPAPEEAGEVFLFHQPISPPTASPPSSPAYPFIKVFLCVKITKYAITLLTILMEIVIKTVNLPIYAGLVRRSGNDIRRNVK
jgi:hypothetical protein